MGTAPASLRYHYYRVIQKNIYMRCIHFAFAVVLTAMIACNNQPVAVTKENDPSADSLVARGEYLVSAIGCDDCHSPKRMGARGPELIPELRLSGFPQNRPLMPVDTGALHKGWVLLAPDLTAAVGPWGTSYASNITGDSTGIGMWTEAQFRKAIREGKSKGLDGTRPLLPPMPWQNLARLSDPDINAIYAFLRSTAPVKNTVPPPVINHSN